MNIIQAPAHPTNYRIGRSKPIDAIVFHHIVGDAASAIARFKIPGVEVSSTYIIGSDGKIYQAVKEEDTPYTNGNADWNSRSITIEHAGPPYAEAMYQASIQLCKDIITRRGISIFKRHREVSDAPTACPGTLDVERILREASNMDKMTRADVAAMFPALTGDDAVEADLAYWENRLWSDFTKAISAEARVVVKDTDLDYYFTKWMTRPATQADKDYWRGRAQAKLVRAISQDPASISVGTLPEPNVIVNGSKYVKEQE